MTNRSLIDGCVDGRIVFLGKFGEEVLQSSTGVQPVDPFELTLFTLAVDEVARTGEYVLNVWYLDDASIGDTPEKVLHDAHRMINQSHAIGGGYR